jgi:hypothetical protein
MLPVQSARDVLIHNRGEQPNPPGGCSLFSVTYRQNRRQISAAIVLSCKYFLTKDLDGLWRCSSLLSISSVRSLKRLIQERSRVSDSDYALLREIGCKRQGTRDEGTREQRTENRERGRGEQRRLDGDRPGAGNLGKWGCVWFNARTQERPSWPPCLM